MASNSFGDACFMDGALSSTSRYRGVSWDQSRGKWCAQVQVIGRHVHLGRFESEEDAAAAVAAGRARLMTHQNEDREPLARWSQGRPPI